jgi:diaminopimelate decarboxylase
VNARTPARTTWPDALVVSAGGRLELDGCDLATLARERGTPLWAISRSTVETSFGELLAAFRRRFDTCEIAYSIKAHNTMAVISLLHRLGAKVDCSAEHEFEIALRAGVAAGDVILNGNGKSDAALRSAARLGVRQVNVDSLDEVRRLDAIAAELGTRVRCVVRVQLGYAALLAEDPAFEATLRIGEGKFGSNIPTGQGWETIQAVIAAPNLDFAGLSHHVGFSGYMGDYRAEYEVMHHREATREVCAVANEVQRRYGVRVERLDLGGGFRCGNQVLLSTPGAAADLALHDLPSADDYAEAIFSTLERELVTDSPPLVQFESGGGQIANAVVMLAEVSEVKDVRTTPPQRYVVIDGSMMMFVSRGLMRVGHPVLLAERPFADVLEDVPVDVVGQTCVYDSVAEDIRLPEVARGDIVALLNQGAYCETESTQFNAFPRPEVVLLDAGRAIVVKRRETLADICGRDVDPAQLWPTP